MTNNDKLWVKLNFNDDASTLKHNKLDQKPKTDYDVSIVSINENATLKYVKSIKNNAVEAELLNDYHSSTIDLEQNHDNNIYEKNIKKLYNAFEKELNQIIFYNRFSVINRNAMIIKITKEDLLSIENLSSKAIKSINNAFDNVLKSKGWDLIEPIVISFDHNLTSGKSSNGWLWNTLNQRTLSIEPAKQLKLSILTQYFQPTVNIMLEESDVSKILSWFKEKVKNKDNIY